MITYHDRPRAWTPAEDDQLLTYVGQQKLTTLAGKLGRSPLALERRLREHGQYVRESATRHAGMSINDVADALGVTKNHVWRWIQIGWLQSRKAFGVQRRYVTIDPDAVLRFLRERGALLPNLKADRDWADEVAAARSALLARFIGTNDVAAALCVHRGALHYLRTRVQMPDPALRLGGCLSDYYDRAAIRAWAAAHPRYPLKESL
jgi:hypothetical protein